MTTSPVDMVNHPPHYTSHPSGIEAITITRLLMFDLGNAVKYVMRRNNKWSAVEDLQKARFYFNDAMTSAHETLYVPRRASDLLREYAAADDDQLAVSFYLAVADQQWDTAITVLDALIDAAS